MKLLTQRINRYITRVYDKTHLFTDKEAWGLYRFAAFVEAGIWGFFAATVIYQLLGLPLAESVMAFGRSLVGVAFTVYAIFVVLVARSMEWGIGRILLALLAGAIPFGALVFEYFMGKYRKLHPAVIAPPKGYDE